MHALTSTARAAVQAVITAHHAELQRIPGFVKAEPGFPLVQGRFLREPAVIVLVAGKKPASELLPEDRVPRQLGDYRVAVMQASPSQQLDLELEARRGLGPGPSPAFEALGSQAPASESTYVPPEGEAIDQVYEVSSPFLCHVGPDAGWPVLRPFLEATRRSLTVAMYDFNAEHIVKTFAGLIREDGLRVALSWDDGMTDDENAIRARLRKLQGGTAFRALLVRCGKGRRFASAYHEKVAVRDHRSFWLSSGNWSRRSQPDIDPVGDASQARGRFGKGNREWHVICEDPDLAGVFEAYIEHDLAGSQQELEAGGLVALAAGPGPLPEVFVPLDTLAAGLAPLAAPTPPVGPQRRPATPRPVRVQPVLTPDNYLRHVEALMASARRSLYLQFSYISWSDNPRDEDFRRMLLGLAERSFSESLDLRIIVGDNGAADKIRKLVEAGFNQDVFRVQGGVHNKGIVVDGRAVLVSSTNWSGDGVLRNRDAGLIIHDPEVADYYQGVFLDDWEHRARRQIEDDASVRLALPGQPTPPGMVRMAWRDFHG